jgi:hypothetical protein
MVFFMHNLCPKITVVWVPEYQVLVWMVYIKIKFIIENRIFLHQNIPLILLQSTSFLRIISKIFLT